MHKIKTFRLKAWHPQAPSEAQIGNELISHSRETAALAYSAAAGQPSIPPLRAALRWRG